MAKGPATNRLTGVPITPWRNKKFLPARGRRGFEEGGTVEVEVFLPCFELFEGTEDGAYHTGWETATKENGQWHLIRFATDREGFLKLAKLPDLARAHLLFSLITWPLEAGHISPSKRPRARGRNTPDRVHCWNTARILAAICFVWISRPATRTGALYRRVCKLMRRAHPDWSVDPAHVVAYLVGRNWRNGRQLQPDRFIEWTAAANPATLHRALKRKSPEHTTLLQDLPLIFRELTKRNNRRVKDGVYEALISGILAEGPTERDVFCAPRRPSPTRARMNDFRLI
jgi:hypothetical protein